MQRSSFPLLPPCTRPPSHPLSLSHDELSAQACWHAGLPGREALAARAIPYLLTRLLQPPPPPAPGTASTGLLPGAGALLKRLLGLRRGLSLFDYDDAASIAGLRRLLLRAAFSPTFLRSPDGRRFLGGLFWLQPQLVNELGAIVRNQASAFLKRFSHLVFPARACGGRKGEACGAQSEKKT